MTVDGSRLLPRASPRRALVARAVAPAAVVGTPPPPAPNTLHGATTRVLHRLADAAVLAARRPSTKPNSASTGLDTLLDSQYEALEDIFCSHRGYTISPKEQREITATGGSATYGELLPQGVDVVMDLLTPVDPAPQGNVFVDLGSGLGRVVLHAALAHAGMPRFERLIGVELSASRHEQAAYMLAQLQERATAGSLAPGAADALARVQLVHGDATCCDALAQATHVFMCSTAFGATACRRIVERLAASPHFQVLVTSRDLPFQAPLMKLAEVCPCAMSWNDRGTAHVYVRRGDWEAVPPHLAARCCSDGGMVWLPATPLPVAVQEPVQGFQVTWSKVLHLVR